MEKWSGEVGRKIRDLWRPFLKIVAYTVLGVLRGSEKSKYLRPFFSDAEHPEDTIIGQLNLEQIVEEREREEREKEERPSPATLGFTKILKLESGREEERRLDFNSSPPAFADRPLQNRRPITLITFPSNTQIDTNSPFKQKTSVGINVDVSELNAEREKEKKIGFRAF
jgi:hypothetical protein